MASTRSNQQNSNLQISQELNKALLTSEDRIEIAIQDGELFEPDANMKIETPQTTAEIIFLLSQLKVANQNLDRFMKCSLAEKVASEHRNKDEQTDSALTKFIILILCAIGALCIATDNLSSGIIYLSMAASYLSLSKCVDRSNEKSTMERHKKLSMDRVLTFFVDDEKQQIEKVAKTIGIELKAHKLEGVIKKMELAQRYFLKAA